MVRTLAEFLCSGLGPAGHYRKPWVSGNITQKKTTWSPRPLTTTSLGALVNNGNLTSAAAIVCHAAPTTRLKTLPISLLTTALLMLVAPASLRRAEFFTAAHQAGNQWNGGLS
jgi:hypothetical protein